MKVLPVIHVLTKQQTLANLDMALAANVDGLFLISMVGNDELAFQMAAEIKQQHPSLYVGVNLLRAYALHAVERALGASLDATWSDELVLTSRQITEDAQSISRLLKTAEEQGRPHEFFAAVAFKHQAAEPNPGAAARMASGLGFIPTTSGQATGKAAPVSKLIAIRDEYPDGRLALASGLTPENLAEFKPFITDAVVATGISTLPDQFDPKKLDAFVRMAHN